MKVIVFASAVPDFFIAHFDIGSPFDFAPRTTGLPSSTDIAERLEKLPAISIAKVQGRARGGGSELVLAFDMRFGAIGLAIFGQPGIGLAIIPGGGGIERLVASAGHAPALEVVLSGGDFTVEEAVDYGWLNRALPEDQLDAFVDRLATRTSNFDLAAVRAIKEAVNRSARMPHNEDVSRSVNTFLSLFMSPAAQARMQALGVHAEKVGYELELSLGDHIDKF
jgi:enoyl-CoA hydratase/carnithine racemase